VLDAYVHSQSAIGAVGFRAARILAAIGPFDLARCTAFAFGAAADLL